MGERNHSGTRSLGLFLSFMTAFQSRVNSIWFGVRITFFALGRSHGEGVPSEQRRFLGDHPQPISVDDQRLVPLDDEGDHLFQRVEHDGMTSRSRPDDDRIDSIEECDNGVVVRFADLLELIALFGTIPQLNHWTHNQFRRVAFYGDPCFF